MSNGRLIVVSNRLPVSLTHHKGSWKFQESSGGLVTALVSLQKERSFEWVGWPGREVPPLQQAEIEARFQREHHCRPVFLSRKDVNGYYNGFCNQVIWPLFHYLPNEVHFLKADWKTYENVNLRFAETVLQTARPNDLVWIHDFHLMLVPALLRQKMPSLKIGFFLHIPFPSSEVYRLLAVRQEILQGLLGCDLIGFHSYDYLRHFESACLRLLGLESQPSLIKLSDRQVKLGVFPIGIDPARFDSVLKSQPFLRTKKKLEQVFAGRKVILGIDRMDYTKGIPFKLRAFEHFLKKNPAWRDKVLLYQVAIPSRQDVTAYKQLKVEVDEMVSDINGKYGTLERTPICYLNKSISFEHLCALYASADVALLTPIRDGMNLVAQEYVLCSGASRGILILSEFTGAAHSLSGCLLVNPWNLEEVVSAIETALEMEMKEWKQRNAPMYRFVRTNTAMRWGERFIDDLSQESMPEDASVQAPAIDLKKVSTDIIGAYKSARCRLLFLDYDGTLTPIRPTPGEAVPAHNVITMLEQLGSDPQSHVSVVSGRDRRQLEEWFNRLPINICAEHGFAFRDADGIRWQHIEEVDLSWKEEVRQVFEYFSERTPGAIIEDKPSSLSWHYRRTDPVFGQWQADELLMHLDEILARLPVEAMRGHKVIEVRPLGIHKGRFVQHMLDRYAYADFILCIGDDKTDEDMYKTLPSTAWTCNVGSAHTTARYFIETQTKVLALLETLVAN